MSLLYWKFKYNTMVLAWWISIVILDLHLAATFLLRLPLVPLKHISSSQLVHAMRVFPIVGAGIGIVGAIIYFIAIRFNLTPFLSAVLAIAAISRITGGFHEDGLADTLDSFGAISSTRSRKLEIMRDSTVGTFGVLVLIFCITARIAAITSIHTTFDITVAFIVAESMGRAVIPLSLHCIPPARPDGLGAMFAVQGNESTMSTVIAMSTAITLTLLLLPINLVIRIILTTLLTVWITIRVACRHVGGQTGDILGAISYISDTTILVVLSS